ncbi:hypothetical protein [Haloarcula rubripromontorii]|uniref:hypothetical protein n=1 Tax=Haloarcula rubripromontorii TaxID=1705562 RepID=UPI00345BD2E1
MYRRGFLSAAVVVGVSGCSDLSAISDMNTKSLGDTVTFGEIEVTVTDAMTARKVKTYLETVNGERTETHTAPSNAKFALFRVESHNTDITDRDGPVVNTGNYDTMTDDDDTIYIAGVNDIRVYGGSEGGYLPETRASLSYDGLRVNGYEIDDYPAKPSDLRPSIGANESIAGWTFGLIEKDKPPQLKIEFNGESAMWEAGSTDLSTPPPNPSTVSK